MAVLPDSLSKEQKIGFSLLLVFALLSISLGALQIRNTMYGPLSLNSRPPVNIKDQVDTIDALRFRDTDFDGLSDFDELYIYGTSPYLLDTFSYGMSDKEVLAKGLPLCPKGQDCTTPIATGEAAQSGGAAAALNLYAPQLGEAPPDILTTLSDPAKLRALLITQGGVDPGILSKVTDEQLKLLASQAMSDTSTIEKIKALQQAAAFQSQKSVIVTSSP